MEGVDGRDDEERDDVTSVQLEEIYYRHQFN